MKPPKKYEITFNKGEQYESSRQRGLLEVQRQVITYINKNKLAEKIAK